MEKARYFTKNKTETQIPGADKSYVAHAPGLASCFHIFVLVVSSSLQADMASGYSLQL